MTVTKIRCKGDIVEAAQGITRKFLVMPCAASKMVYLIYCNPTILSHVA